MNPDKIDNNLLSQMQAADSQEGLPVIIRRKGEIFFSQAIGDVVDFRLLDANAMQLQAQDIESLSDEDNIEYIWADLPVRAFLDVSVPALEVPQVWETGFLGAGVRLAIIDTGLDTTNPDFEGRVIATESFISGEGSDDDLNGHGTHVAGIAAGSGFASDGKYRGVAPEASLYIAKVLDRNGSGSMSGVMSGIEWAVDQGAQVINLSLGSSGPCDGTDALSTLCDAAVTQRGVILCVAAGNDGPGASTVGSPGCANEVITIGSVNERNQVSGFSSRGPTSDGRVKPDLCFPGDVITAAQSAGTQLGEQIAPGYVALRGTSMATPHAAGTACLLLQAKPDLTPSDVKESFVKTAQDLGDPANSQGTGSASVSAAFAFVTEGTPTPPDPTPTPPDPTPTPPDPTPTPPDPTPTPPDPTPTPPNPERKGCLSALFSVFG